MTLLSLKPGEAVLSIHPEIFTSVCREPGDDYPTEYYHPAYRVIVLAQGKFSWGPYRYKQNSVKMYEGTSLVQVYAERSFVSPTSRGYGNETQQEVDKQKARESAEEFALSKAQGLEGRNFQTKLLERIELSGQTKRDFKVWLAELPPEFVLKRMGFTEQGGYTSHFSVYVERYCPPTIDTIFV